VPFLLKKHDFLGVFFNIFTPGVNEKNLFTGDLVACVFPAERELVHNTGVTCVAFSPGALKETGGPSVLNAADTHIVRFQNKGVYPGERAISAW